jgi:hypothetical protein
MCVNCKLTAMMETPENPNPQKGRVYPRGWDLAGFYNDEPAGGRVGFEDDDTLRMVYTDPGLAAFHRTIAEGFSGGRMEFFFDGTFFCYRPAIMENGIALPPAWHVSADEPDDEISEEDEIAARNSMVELLREAGIDPDDVFGPMGE